MYIVHNSTGVIQELVAEGTDSVQASASYTLTDNIANLRLTGVAAITGTGNALANNILGNEGTNVIDGGLGNDTLTGSDGNDTYVVNTGDVVSETNAVLATGGTDTVNTSISYALTANVENLVIATALNVSAFANALNNVIPSQAGNNLISAGRGLDTVSCAKAGSTVSVSLAIAGAQLTSGSGSDTLTDVENLSGSAFNDSLTGNAQANVLGGGVGDDSLDGGTGFDTASYFTAASGITINLNTVGAQATGGAGTDTIISMENLNGSAFDDTLTGNAGANVIFGGDGNDTITGGAGADALLRRTGAGTFVFDNVLASDTIADFVSGSDKLRIVQSGIAVGNADTTISKRRLFSTAAPTFGGVLTPVQVCKGPLEVSTQGWTCDSMYSSRACMSYVPQNCSQRLRQSTNSLCMRVMGGGSP